jgi:hypothetical protein
MNKYNLTNFRTSQNDVNFKPLIITSLIFGFLLIPLHEFGHVIFHWLTGNPEGMSYARDYLLGNGSHTFLGVLGGPLLPLITSSIAVILIYRSSISLSTLYPIAILGAFERLILYITLGLPSDEKELSDFQHWNRFTFEHIILLAEIILLAFVIYSMFKFKISLKMKILCILIPIISFIIMAAFGVFVIERFLFTEQYHLQFG